MGVDWINLAEDRGKWQSLKNMVTKFEFRTLQEILD